jgi:hypothetical protein
MLNRELLAREMHDAAEKIFSSQSSLPLMTADAWTALASHPMFLAQIDEERFTRSLVTWTEHLALAQKIPPLHENYSVIAVDGSQVYPDRHLAGVSCYLLNAGGCILRYTQERGSAHFFTFPRLGVPSQDAEEAEFSVDLVDLEREGYEFEVALEQLAANTDGQQPICLVDGSLIFWHLESKTPAIREHFLQLYLHYLEQFMNRGILVAGYISLPKSRELVHLLQAGLCSYEAFPSSPLAGYQKQHCATAHQLTDTTIAQWFLPPQARSTLFRSTSQITKQYPESLKPYFFYLNVGQEIARIEIPAFIAQNHQLVEKIAQVCVDQSIKGYGYPVVLAEAHEQAVIKGPDRDFFYHLICKIGIDQQKRMVVSQKSMKKRSMGL